MPVPSQAATLSIIICTHDRPDLLATCLEALFANHRHAAWPEVIVVDSASGAPARARIEDMARRFPGVTLVREFMAGLSRARNAGLAKAAGQWVAYLDDDTIPAPDWIPRALELTASVPDDCAIIAGAVHPHAANARIRSLPPRWRQLLSIIELEGQGDRTEAPSMCGANVLFRRSELLAVGGFPETLGRVGTNLLSGEEKFIEQLLIGKGKRLWYSDRLRVDHQIAPTRLQWGWVTSRAYWEGASDAQIAKLLGRPIPAMALLKAAIGAGAYGLAHAVPRRQTEQALRFWYNIGLLAHHLRILGAPSPQAAPVSPVKQ
ncbi:glycosyl transferase family 2 [Azorhizobium oxalatiphilum]|uniref:Glycosyl transferase family 2 n=1 Tax=Azorhizobium oxalatiphilum TaxID=980631 RepID=A0A917C913_9HYPH|nr:glycosyltransferase family 2 protein [Azorhizobium oxalatiphilum]GGF78821.1 glycosyl transferase family 2 [Azorhizobium oxalatiphilum]